MSKALPTDGELAKRRRQVELAQLEAEEEEIRLRRQHVEDSKNILELRAGSQQRIRVFDGTALLTLFIADTQKNEDGVTQNVWKV